VSERDETLSNVLFFIKGRDYDRYHGEKNSCTLYMFTDNKGDVQSVYTIIIFSGYNSDHKRNITHSDY
jgi:hypothetical protein